MDFYFFCEIYYSTFAETDNIRIVANSVKSAYEDLKDEISRDDVYWAINPDTREEESPVGFAILSEKEQGLNLEYFEEKGDLQIETNFE